MLPNTTPRISRIQNRTQARQCVLSGPVDLNGFADFIEDGGGLSAVTTKLTLSPILVSIGLGFDNKGYPLNYAQQIDTELAFSLNDNDENYLYLDIDTQGVVTEGVSILPPNYLPSEPSTPATGEFYYNIYHNEAGKVFDGAVFNPVRRVYLGKVTTSAGAITDIKHDGYQIIDRTPLGVEFFTGEFFDGKPVYQYTNEVLSDITAGTIETYLDDLTILDTVQYQTDRYALDSMIIGTSRAAILYRSDSGVIEASSDGVYSVKAGTKYSLKYTK